MEEVRGMAKCAEGPNRVPCGTRRDPGLLQRPLEQMGSISYFVTPPFHCCAMSFSRAPTHLAIYFVLIYISRFNVPPPFERNAYMLYVHIYTHNAHSHFLFVCRLPPAILVTLLSEHFHRAPRLRFCQFLPASRCNNATK